MARGKCSLNVAIAPNTVYIIDYGLVGFSVQNFNSLHVCLTQCNYYVLWLVPWPDTAIISWDRGRLSSAVDCTLVGSSGVKMC